jgi:DMSO/TMAO reductase YedYZ heme-binding membrane subunit
MPPRRRSPLEGRTLVAFAALIASAEAALSLATADAAEPGLRALIRITAKTSLLWFVLTFAASALVALRPSPASKWLLRNRRYLGLAFAVSHATHLAAILGLGAHAGARFWSSLAASTAIGGGAAYLLLLAMVLTSADGAQKRLGRTRWRALHLTGMWTFWLVFTSSYAGRLGSSLWAAFAMTLLLGAAALRVVRAVTRR